MLPECDDAQSTRFAQSLQIKPEVEAEKKEGLVQYECFLSRYRPQHSFITGLQGLGWCFQLKLCPGVEAIAMFQLSDQGDLGLFFGQAGLMAWGNDCKKRWTAWCHARTFCSNEAEISRPYWKHWSQSLHSKSFFEPDA